MSESAPFAIAETLPFLTGRAEAIVRWILAARDNAAFPSVLEQPVDGPLALDLLWGEFFVTGRCAPVVRIASVLDIEDLVRRYLVQWLRQNPAFGGSKAMGDVVATLKAAGLTLDLESRRIITEGDLDCLCVSIARRQFRIFKELPFSLSADDLTAVMTKGAALWSLRLNARSHEIVREVCVREGARPGGAARLHLVGPIDDAKPFAY